jgi:lipopolysaccharide transport system ATP-binding protein
MSYLLNVQGLWKRLCKRPDRALRYAMQDLGSDLLGVHEPPQLRLGEFWALQDISFGIRQGEVVGIIGQNGAGKSTLIRIISGIIRPTHGRISLSSKKLAFIDSDGGLNPLQTGRENAKSQLVMHGLPQDSLVDEIIEIEAFADIGDFFEAPVGSYSLGMRLRLAFAVYSRLSPDLFIIDEALGGGDEQFRNRFRTYLRNYIDSGGAMLLCSHEMIAVQSFCERCLLLDRGKSIMEGPTVEVIAMHHQLCRERDARSAPASLVQNKKISHANLDQGCLIRSVIVKPANEAKIVMPGGSITIELDVAVNSEIRDVACGIEIGSGDHIALATIAGGFPHNAFILRPPYTKLVCSIKHLPLAPGLYDLRVSLAVSSAVVVLSKIGYEDAPVSLIVEAPPSEIANLVQHRDNIVHISADWELGYD